MIKSRTGDLAKGRPQRNVFASKQAGVSLVELMIVTAIIGIVAIGMSDLFIEMSLLQSKVEQGAAFTEVRNQISQAVRSPPISAVPVGVIPAWDRTVQDAARNPEMACLRDNTPCVSLDAGVRRWNRLTLVDSGGVVIFDGHDDTAGFNTRGVACNTFNTGAPDANCPLSYDLRWSATCADSGGVADACVSPNIEVRATAEYAVPPQIHRGFDPNKHSFLVSRGGSVRKNEEIRIQNVENETALGSNGGEDGVDGTAGNNCKTTWKARRLNTIVSDPGGIVTLVPPTGFTLAPGVYNCQIRAPGYKIGGTFIRLQSTAGDVVSLRSSPSVATRWAGSTTAELVTSFTLTNPTTFVVEQYCTTLPGDEPSYGSIRAENSFGLPLPDEGGSFANIVYTTVNCIRVRCVTVGCE